MTDTPGPGDVTVEHGGARIYCSPAAGLPVDGGQLNVRRDGHDRLRFVVRHARRRLP